MPAAPIYTLRAHNVYEAMETSPRGLSSDEAIARMELYGRNILSEQHKVPLSHKLFKAFWHPHIGFSLATSVIALFITEYIPAIIIFLLTIANTIFSFWREYRAEKEIEKLQAILPTFAHVIRDGEDMHIPSQEIVPGDLLVLEEGDNIAADARVVEEFGLRTNNASLTGESLAARKMADPCYLEGRSELEQTNLIFAGTSVASGTGRAVVYATGMLTQFGRIAHLTQSVQEQPSPLHKELEKLHGTLIWIAIGLASLVLLVGLLDPATRSRIYNPYSLALGILVAMIPEGLPATLTLTLAMAAQRLTKHGVLVKKLSIIETLGNVSVICTDKSGTLTQNQMTVREVWVGHELLKVTGAGYEPHGNFIPNPTNQPFEPDLMALLDAATCCNNSRINAPSPEHPTWTSLGDQTEAALKVASLKSDVNEAALAILLPRVHEIPFDARRKRMTTIHRELDREIAFVKGAPREVLQLCTHIQLLGETIELTNEIREEVLAANDYYASNALRVLAIARRYLPLKFGEYTADSVEREMTFLGLMAMMDPPRPEVEEAIKVFREAGIRIAMITGDYGLTALSLAKRIGMLNTPNPRIVTGAELDELNDFELQRILKEEAIFARMAPEHKMRLVSTFQAMGEVVVVTGDGVNDAPALRKADVGIAMGLIGTDVAKEAADIILTQDNFGAIASAIAEGRTIFENIKKFITYIFASNIPEIMPFLVTAMMPVPLVLRIRQVLAIDIGTDLAPALALGMEKPEPDIMKRPPRHKNEPLIQSGLYWRAFGWLGMIETVLAYAGFVAVYFFAGHIDLLIPSLAWLKVPAFMAQTFDAYTTIVTASTVYFVSVVMLQVGNAWACRSNKLRSTTLGWFSNKYIWYSIAIEIAIIFVMLYVKEIREFMLFSNKIKLEFWIGLSIFPFIIYGLEWMRKALVRSMKRGQGDTSSK